MQVVDKDGEIRKSFFWFLDKDDKKKCSKMNKQNAFIYVSQFLPQFGIYKYRDPEEEKGSFLVVQKFGRRVQILGTEKDSDVQDAIFNWTLDTIKYLRGIAGDLPSNLDAELFKCHELFSKWTIRFLPQLPAVPAEDKNGKEHLVPQQPLMDSPTQSYVCFKNGVVVVSKDKEPEIIPYVKLANYQFVWDNEVREFDCSQDILKEGATGKWWDFLQNCAKEDRDGEWKVNQGMLDALVSGYGYLLHNFYPPDQRKVVILYDRTDEWKAGGNGKSIIAKSFREIKPTHFVDMKKEKTGDNRFLLSGYTPDKRVVVLSDTSQEYSLENHYNLITDGFTVEDKNEKTYVISEEKAPKLIMTTNYTINNSDRSDRRRQFFVPIGTFYGTLFDQTQQTPADIHGGWLLDDRSWKEQDWIDFYATCVYCVSEYLSKGLEPFDDQILADRQLLKATAGSEVLLLEMTNFIKGLFTDGDETEVSRQQVIDFYSSLPDLDKFITYGENWKVRTFKKVCSLHGFQVNPGRSRFQKINKETGKPEDFYLIVKPLSTAIRDDDKKSVDEKQDEKEQLAFLKVQEEKGKKKPEVKPEKKEESTKEVDPAFSDFKFD